MKAAKDKAKKVLTEIVKELRVLTGQIINGEADPERVLALLRIATENRRETSDEGASHGTYILESCWIWDQTHHEFATIGLEKWESEIPFESLLDPAASDENKRLLLEGWLQPMFQAQVSKTGAYRMLRLYRVANTRYFGYNIGLDIAGRLEREAIDAHFVLIPICDFDDQGQPVRCQIKK